MNIPVLLRTYNSPEEEPVYCTIWEAARATSAAPTFFKRMVIGTTEYIDGGMGANNPTDLLLQEAKSLFPDGKIACVLSIGTGKPDTIRIPKPGLFQRVIPLDAGEHVSVFRGTQRHRMVRCQDASASTRLRTALYWHMCPYS